MAAPSRMHDCLFDLRGSLVRRDAVDSELLGRLRAEFDPFCAHLERRRILEPQPPIRAGERRLPAEFVDHEHAEIDG